MRVNTDELERQAAALRYISARLCDIEDTVQQISHVLCRERFGEMFRSPLNIMARTIGNRTDEMNRMSAALQQISAIYERTERQIVDEAEHANVHHEHSLAGLIMIPKIPFWVNWTTEPTHPRYIPISRDPGEDLQIVDGLPTVDDLDWAETAQAFDGLRDALIGVHRAGFNMPVERPVFEPIHIPQAPPAHTNPDPAGMIDWTPWDV